MFSKFIFQINRFKISDNSRSKLAKKWLDKPLFLHFKIMAQLASEVLCEFYENAYVTSYSQISRNSFSVYLYVYLNFRKKSTNLFTLWSIFGQPKITVGVWTNLSMPFPRLIVSNLIAFSLQWMEGTGKEEVKKTDHKMSTEEVSVRSCKRLKVSYNFWVNKNWKKRFQQIFKNYFDYLSINDFDFFSAVDKG